MRAMSEVPEVRGIGTETGTLPLLDATTPASSAIAEVSRGALIGRYVVLSTLGAGGMGVVLAAYDPELDRRVAIKLLKTQSQSSARTRLQREAQALAKLHHGNVVGVHDVGVHDGQLFVAMEFVAGKTLGAWMSEVQQPRPWKEVLSVFAEAGRGLVAAHEAGLVHRDFKPDNVMLGDDGRVRVMDFGLARAESDEGDGDGEVTDVKLSLEHTAGKQLLSQQLTQTGSLLGTPAYMSPEQFEGMAADARSDQFGFCVSLYQALYGMRPFAGTTLPTLLRAVTQGQVEPAPKEVAVPTWLRAIVVRGLAPKPQERWPSMRALLEALAEDPAARRRKWFAVVGVVGLLGAATWGASWAVRADAQTCAGLEERLVGVWDEARRAEVKAAIEGTKLSYAAGTWERVEQRLDEYTQEWVAARVQACEATHNGEQSDELLDLRMACLDDRLQHVRATVEVLARADESIVKKAVEAVASLPTLDRCADVDALTASIPPPEDAETAKRVVELDEQLVKAEALQNTGKYSDGLVLADRVVAEGASLGYEPLLARAWLRQGALQKNMGNYELAEATLERAYESALGQQMVIEAAEVARELMDLMGNILVRHADGWCWEKDAKALARAVDTDDALANYLTALGILLNSEGKYDEARDHYERAFAIREKALRPEHPQIATSLYNLGNVAWSQGKYEEARAYYERALAAREKALGPEHPKVASVLNGLGALAVSEGKYEEARRYFERTLAIQEKALGPEHRDVASTLNNLGAVALREGKFEETRSHFVRSLAITEKALGSEHPDVASTLHNLGLIASHERKYEEARGHFWRALAIWEKALGPEHPEVVKCFVNLGLVAESEGKYEEARGYTEQALSIVEKALGPEHPEVATVLEALSTVAESEGKYEEARDYHERTLAIREKTLGPDHPDVSYTLTDLGLALLVQAKPAEALPHIERALVIRTANPSNPLDLASIQFTLARALWEAPAESGRDRERARTLAELARTAYADAGETSIKELHEVQAWQAEHRE
jgi:tetratricopeptide (TPR) repeat protein/tRNA A-37 threonylcarbamoyl transferase component Bud32